MSVAASGAGSTRVREYWRKKPQVPPLRYPGFPVELGGVGELHAAFLTESRTRGRVRRSVQEIRVARLIRPTYAEANVGHPSSS